MKCACAFWLSSNGCIIYYQLPLWFVTHIQLVWLSYNCVTHNAVQLLSHVMYVHNKGLLKSLDSLTEEGNIRMLALFDNEEV